MYLFSDLRETRRGREPLSLLQFLPLLPLQYRYSLCVPLCCFYHFLTYACDNISVFSIFSCDCLCPTCELTLKRVSVSFPLHLKSIHKFRTLRTVHKSNWLAANVSIHIRDFEYSQISAFTTSNLSGSFQIPHELIYVYIYVDRYIGPTAGFATKFILSAIEINPPCHANSVPCRIILKAPAFKLARRPVDLHCCDAERIF